MVLIWLHFSSVVTHWASISFIGKIANVSLLLYTALKISVPVQLISTGHNEAIRKKQIEELTIPLLFTAVGAGLQKSLFI